MRKFITIFSGFILIGLSGCQIQKVSQPVPVTATAQVLSAQEAQNKLIAEITTKIGNGEVLAPQYKKTVQFKDGKYETGSGADYLLVEMLPQMAVGDLNGDGQTDAAVLLAENGGGSGVFVSLVPFISTGSGFTEAQAVLIDDRPRINALTIQDGKISLDALIHGADDSMASPSMKVVETYTFSGDALTLTAFSSAINGTEHSIKIDTVSQKDAAGDLEVKGSMPVAPFENQLRYRIYAANGQVLLNEGPFTVKSEDVGKPGTFDNSLKLTNIASGTKVRFELAELSAKDGSPLCMSSVELTVK